MILFIVDGVVEIWTSAVLCMNACPNPVPIHLLPPTDRLIHRVIDSRELAKNSELLNHVYGLLLEAHYRTTPDDLWRMLDAPNIKVLRSVLLCTIVFIFLLSLCCCL